MHCVLCGISLTDENGAGLVCKTCKPDPRMDKKAWERVITVVYCFKCGQPYRPLDKSVRHRSCFPGDMMTGYWSIREQEEKNHETDSGTPAAIPGANGDGGGRNTTLTNAASAGLPVLSGET
jgi:Zn ribbon nucleic-acid-binding protein